MEGRRRARFEEKGTELTCSLQVPHSPQISTWSPAQQGPESHPFGVLWRLHDTSMID